MEEHESSHVSTRGVRGHKTVLCNIQDDNHDESDKKKGNEIKYEYG